MFDLVYLYHSGFALCFDKFSVLIDYYEDSMGTQTGFVHDHLVKRPGPLYILASHFHADHFSPEVFSLAELKEDVRYVFSKDIYKRRRKWLPEDDIAFLSVGDEFADENLRIKAYDSTDCGVSFYLQAAGLKLFHAGDLNNWHWRDESTPEEAATAEKQYLTVLHKIQEEVLSLDVAMFPTDPRIGSDYLRGAEQFVSAIACRYFVPMHFDAAYDKAAAFKDFAATHGSEFLTIEKRGQQWTLPGA